MVPALHYPPYHPFCSRHGVIDRGPQRGRAAFEDYARQAAQNNLDSAHLIDAATRPVHVAGAHADAFDGARELPEASPQLAPAEVGERSVCPHER
jgi:hypothetical protein